MTAKDLTMVEKIIMDYDGDKTIARYLPNEKILELIFYGSDYFTDDTETHRIKILTEPVKMRVLTNNSNSDYDETLNMEDLEKVIDELMFDKSESGFYKKRKKKYFKEMDNEYGYIHTVKDPKTSFVTVSKYYKDDPFIDIHHQRVIISYTEDYNKKIVEHYRKTNKKCIYFPIYTVFIETYTQKGEHIQEILKVADSHFNNPDYFIKNGNWMRSINDHIFYEKIYQYNDLNNYHSSYNYNFNLSYVMIPELYRDIFGPITDTMYRQFYSKIKPSAKNTRTEKIATVKYEGNKYTFDIKDFSMLAQMPFFPMVFCRKEKLAERYIADLNQGVNGIKKYNGSYTSHMEYKDYDNAMIGLLDLYHKVDSVIVLNGSLHREYMIGYDSSRIKDGIYSFDHNPYVDQVNINPNVFVYDIDLEGKGTIPCKPRIVMMAPDDLSSTLNDKTMEYNNDRDIMMCYNPDVYDEYITMINQTAKELKRKPFTVQAGNHNWLDYGSYSFNSNFDITKFKVDVDFNISKRCSNNIRMISKNPEGLIITVHNTLLRYESVDRFKFNSDYPKWMIEVDIFDKRVSYGYASQFDYIRYDIEDNNAYSYYGRRGKDKIEMTITKTVDDYNEDCIMYKRTIFKDDYSLDYHIADIDRPHEPLQHHIHIHNTDEYKRFKKQINRIREEFHLNHDEIEYLIGSLSASDTIRNAFEQVRYESYKGAQYSPLYIMDVLNDNGLLYGYYSEKHATEYDEMEDGNMYVCRGRKGYMYSMYDLFYTKNKQILGTIDVCREVLKRFISDTSTFNKIFYFI